MPLLLAHLSHTTDLCKSAPLVAILILLPVIVIIFTLLLLLKCCHLALNVLELSYHKDIKKPNFKATSPSIKPDLQGTVTTELSPSTKCD